VLLLSCLICPYSIPQGEHRAVMLCRLFQCVSSNSNYDLTMKHNTSFLSCPRLHSPALGLAAVLAASVAHATPYATCLTNNGNGSISFRLNQTTGTNDLVQVISGSATNSLQLPSADSANFIARGLVITNLGIGAGPFKVRIKHTGSGVISTNGPA